MKVRSEEQIRRELTAAFLAGSGYADLRPGGRLSQILGAAAKALHRIETDALRRRDSFLRKTARGEDLRYLASDVLPEPLMPGEKAAALGGAFVFERPEALADPVTVSAGHKVYRKADGFTYRTTADATIPALGTTSNTVSVIATQKGSIGNCTVGEIDGLETVDGVTSCRNTAAIANGVDAEADEDLRERMRLYALGLSGGNRAGIEKAILEIEDETYGRVRFCRLGEAEATAGGGYIPVWIDDGAGTAGEPEAQAEEVLIDAAAGGEWVLYTQSRPIQASETGYVFWLNDLEDPDQSRYTVIDAWGQVRRAETDPLEADDKLAIRGHLVYGGLVAVVQRVVDGVLSNIYEEPPLRAGGTVIQVRPASKVTATVIASVSVEAAGNRAAIFAACSTAIQNYINNRNIGEPVYHARVISTLMGVDGVADVPWVTINGVEASKYCKASEVLRCTDSDISIL